MTIHFTQAMAQIIRPVCRLCETPIRIGDLVEVIGPIGNRRAVHNKCWKKAGREAIREIGGE